MASLADYVIEVDTGLDGAYNDANDDISDRVVDVSWSVGMDQPYQEVANPTQCYLTLRNDDGEIDIERGGAIYEGLLTPGMLLRVKMVYDGNTQQMWEGRIATIDPLPGAKMAQPFVQVRCVDPLYDLSRFDYSPELLTDLRTDEALDAIFERAPVAYPYDTQWAALGLSYLGETTFLYDPSGFKGFEEGASTIEFVGAVSDAGSAANTVTAMSYIKDIMDQECGGRFWWDGRDHKFKFHSRHHDLLAVASEADVSTVDVDGAKVTYGDDIVNRVVLRWTPKGLGAANSFLYEADNVPFTLRVGQARRIQARYRDPDNMDVRVTAETVVQPVLGTHVVTDDDSSVSLSVDVRSNAVVFDITNQGFSDVSVTEVVVRGTPLLTYNSEEIIKLDPDSMRDYGKRSRTYTTKIQNQGDADGYSQYLLNTFKVPLPRVGGFSIEQVEGDTETRWAQFLTVGDIVGLDDAIYSGHVADYVIVGERHRVSGDGPFHRADYVVRRQDKVAGLILGVVGFAELGETSYLVF